jgi:hypothetical protein
VIYGLWSCSSFGAGQSHAMQFIRIVCWYLFCFINSFTTVLFFRYWSYERQGGVVATSSLSTKAYIYAIFLMARFLLGSYEVHQAVLTYSSTQGSHEIVQIYNAIEATVGQSCSCGTKYYLLSVALLITQGWGSICLVAKALWLWTTQTLGVEGKAAAA